MEEKFCGVWGQLREEFLKVHEPKFYNLLIERGNLEEYLTNYQVVYSKRGDKMAEKLAEERGVTAELYRNDPLEWILRSEKIQEDVRAALSEEIQK
ncbi:MAG: TnpV protein [Selenomonadaceae bacterium]|nr:TnpV protein [Selenomonadaceae bacterium]